jgi:hypothetical protein
MDRPSGVNNLAVGEPDLNTVLSLRDARKRQTNFRLPLCGFLLILLMTFLASSASAQTFRFSLRADPDVIPANGISTSSIVVQVQDEGATGITAVPMVRFITTAGTIESNARLSGGVARVLLRSSTTPGTAIITAFIGNAREQIAVEFAADNLGIARYLDISGAYVAYGDTEGVINASGKCVLNFGETRIESDVRLDIDLRREFIWAEGNAGTVVIRHGRGQNAKELRGDRLFYDLRRRRGVMRRSDASLGPARQEFMGTDFRPLPQSEKAGHSDKGPGTPIVPAKVGAPAIPLPALQSEEPIIDSTTRTNPAGPVASAMQADAPVIVEPPVADNAAEPKGNAAGGVRLSAEERDKGSVATDLLKKLQPGQDTESDGVLKAGISTLYRIESESLAGSTGQPGAVNSQSSGDRERTTVLAILPENNRGGALGSSDEKAGAPVTGDVSGAPQQSAKPPVYSPLDTTPLDTTNVKAILLEPDPPFVDVEYGYWVAARRMLVYPHDKIQCERATLFFNGGKVFSMPRYVVPLNGAFNPGQDMVAFNTAGGLTLNVPYYYMASPKAQGTVYFQHAPGSGFAAEKPGFALAVEQQYWMSDKSNGRLIVDQLGRGAWNLGWEHKLQFSPTMNGRISLDMPRHRDMFLRTSLYKEYSSMQLGMEGFYTRRNESDSGNRNQFQGQFFVRMRPRQLGKSGWFMTVSGNMTAMNRYNIGSIVTSGGGGGVGLPGRPTGSTLVEQYRSVFGQTLDISLQGPERRLWKGASLHTTLRATAFNNSLGRRGVAPGWTFGLNQNFGRLASMQLSYSYDKSGGIFAGTDVAHFLNGSLLLNPMKKVSINAFATKSLTDSSLYSAASLDYAFAPKWRAGLFTDYSTFGDTEDYLDYGWTVGRMVGQREISVNWSAVRNRIYFELGGFRY